MGISDSIGQNKTNLSNIIKIAEGKSVLVIKLEEYKERLQQHSALGQQLDTIYKIAIAQELVNNGEVNTNDLAKRLAGKYGSVDDDIFENACAVIQDYIKTGGKNTLSGTGLPKTDDSEV